MIGISSVGGLRAVLLRSESERTSSTDGLRGRAELVANPIRPLETAIAAETEFPAQFAQRVAHTDRSPPIEEEVEAEFPSGQTEPEPIHAVALIDAHKNAAPVPAPVRPAVAVNAIADPEPTYEGKPFAEWRRMLKSEMKPELQMESLRAISVLGVYGHAEETATVILDVLDRISEVTAFAAQVNETLSHSESFFPVLAADVKLQMAASYGLYRIGSAAEPTLLAALEDPRRSARTRVIVMTMLAHAANPEAISILIKLQRDNSPMIRDCACESLNGLCSNPHELTPVLLSMCASEDVQVRRQALNRLVQNGFFKAYLDQKLDLHAVTSEQVESIELVPVWILALARHAGTKNDEACRAAIQILAAIGPQAQAAVPALEKLLAAPEAAAYHEAARAGLQKISPPAESPQSDGAAATRPPAP
jgi:hypothetical protein